MFEGSCSKRFLVFYVFLTPMNESFKMTYFKLRKIFQTNVVSPLKKKQKQTFSEAVNTPFLQAFMVKLTPCVCVEGWEMLEGTLSS